MKNNYWIWGLRRISTLIVFCLLLLNTPFGPTTVQATSGACSYHEGVYCEAGPSSDGSVTCNDGWTNSSVNYWDADECMNYLCPEQVVLRDALIQKAKDAGALDIGTSQLCEEAGLSGYETLSLCLDLRQQEIDQVYTSINSQVAAVRYLCYSNVQTTICPDHSTLNSADNLCYCDDGYLWSSSNNSCVTATTSCQEIYGLNSYSTNKQNPDGSYQCECKSGYEFNSTFSSCVKQAESIESIIEIPIMQSTTNYSTFSDVAANSYNYLAIEYAKKEGFISGYPDGTFRPYNTINRAELLKILVNATNPIFPSGIDNNCYSDVKNDQWYAKFVCYAKTKGWITGYEDGSFKPAQPITKAEALKILLETQGVEIPKNITQTPFRDVNISAWYAPYVFKGYELGIIEEYTSLSYNPQNEISRWQVCDYIYRFFNPEE